jgi:shikimate dehydrogenase
VNPSPERLVLLGHPLSHSLSPLFQNAALRAAGIGARYEALDVPRSAIDETLEALRRERAAGNVTIPYKEDVRAACDRLTETARAVGAVNTFWTAVDGALVGDNTDVGGFQAAVRQLIDAPGDREIVAVLGAGGAAAAVLRAVEGWPGARIRMYSRTRARAEQLVQRFKVPAEVAATASDAVANATIVVNATPVGLRRGDDSVPVNVEALPHKSAVLDLAYRPGETAFVRKAKARGLRAMDGLTMLVEQGALSFERWFGVIPDRQAMWDAISSTA